jgi:ubiquinol-cytochrome c reductase cytochrome c1 subunit
MNKKNAIRAAVLAFALVAGTAAASSGPDIRFEPAPTNRLDVESLQRGARNFVNYCLNCHGARFMRYNRLTDLGLTEAQIRDNLILTEAKIGDAMTVTIRPADSKAWFGTVPPDLSVEARVRGRDWLYNYFLGFYKDDTTPTGWNNLVFHNVVMPHVLYELSGTNRLVENLHEDAHEAQKEALAAKRLVEIAPAKDHKYVVRTLEQDTPGTLTPAEYRAFVADLVNYLDYMAEPAKNRRISLGFAVLLYLGLLFVFAYWLKREYWKDVH